jgi:hypothetical protein
MFVGGVMLLVLALGNKTVTVIAGIVLLILGLGYRL